VQALFLRFYEGLLVSSASPAKWQHPTVGPHESARRSLETALCDCDTLLESSHRGAAANRKEDTGEAGAGKESEYSAHPPAVSTAAAAASTAAPGRREGEAMLARANSSESLEGGAEALGPRTEAAQSTSQRAQGEEQEELDAGGRARLEEAGGGLRHPHEQMAKVCTS
jgi:hypothetical protein